MDGCGFRRFLARADETDMMMRNSNTGPFELYDIGNNTITGAAGMGQVGLEWAVAGFGDFSGTGQRNRHADAQQQYRPIRNLRHQQQPITFAAPWARWGWNGRWPASAIFPATSTKPTC